MKVPQPRKTVRFTSRRGQDEIYFDNPDFDPGNKSVTSSTKSKYRSTENLGQKMKSNSEGNTASDTKLVPQRRRILPKIPDKDDDTSKSQNHNGVKVKPSKYDGSTPWMDYLSHFEMCVLVNGWSETQKGLYLAVSLTGQAQAILGDLPAEKRQNFAELVNALEERFAPSSQTELYRVQFKERRQRASETLPELGQSVRRLSNLAYPTAPLDVRETLAKEQFIDALVDSDIRLRIKQSRPKSLNDAVRLAVELEAYNKAESKTREGKGYLRQAAIDMANEVSAPKPSDSSMDSMREWMQTMENSLKTLTETVSKLKLGDSQSGESKASNAKKVIHCFNCGKPGHKIAQCRRPLIAKYRNKYVDKQKKDKNGSVQTLSNKPQNGKIQNGAISTASKDAGIYVDITIAGVHGKFVVDTGGNIDPHFYRDV